MHGILYRHRIHACMSCVHIHVHVYTQLQQSLFRKLVKNGLGRLAVIKDKDNHVKVIKVTV